MVAPSAASAASTPASESTPIKRRSWRWVVLLVALLLGLLVAELLVRWLLFDPSERAVRAAGEMRSAIHFADPNLEDEYWHLNWTLDSSDKKFRSPPFDPVLGWTNQRFNGQTWKHLNQDELPGRRPVLLYGASYAECMTSTSDCFEGLMRKSAVARDYNLINYGVGGYGVDQVLLLMEGSVDHYVEENPIVVIAIVTDTDLERCVLSFRSWPKPRLSFEGGRMLTPEPVFEGGSAAYLEREGVGIWSYAWRYLLHGKHQLQGSWSRSLRGTRPKKAIQNELINQIVIEIKEQLESRDLDYFFLLCTSPRGLPPAVVPGQERRIAGVLAGHQIPFVHARPYFLEEIREGGASMEQLFLQEGPGKNHPSPEGNRVLFRALLDGMQGRFCEDPSFD